MSGGIPRGEDDRCDDLDQATRDIGEMLAQIERQVAGGTPVTIEGSIAGPPAIEAPVILLYWGGRDLGFVDQECIEKMLDETIAKFPDDVHAARAFFLQRMADRVINGPFESLFDAEFPFDRHTPPADAMVEGCGGLVSKRHLRLLIKKMENAKILETHRIGTSHKTISKIFQNMDSKKREEAFSEAYKHHPQDRNAMKVYIYAKLLPDAVYEFDKDTPRRVHSRLVVTELVQHLINARNTRAAAGTL